MEKRADRKKEIWRILAALPAVMLLAAAILLLKQDAVSFLKWYLMLLLMGAAGMPLTGRWFSRFADHGWMFSKILSVAVTGLAVWFLSAIHLLPFTIPGCYLVLLVYVLIQGYLYLRGKKKGLQIWPVKEWNVVFVEEMLFFLAFLVWTYLAGFHPAAYGTEKFMDYGFMEAMMRTRFLPAIDPWYSSAGINYYYGGQYFAVFLTKITGTRVEITYNLMRTMIGGMAFALPFALVYQMLTDRMDRQFDGFRADAPAVGGLIAGLAVSFAGNMHYVIYGVLLPLIQKIRGDEPERYWFPDATRYIGHRPDVPDKTIHEFPCYSFVLGDLHAHVVNIIFVLLVTGLLYAFWKNACARRSKMPSSPAVKDLAFWKTHLLCPELILVSVLLGMFRWSNFWDFVIYYVVTGGVVLFSNIMEFDGINDRLVAVTSLQAVEVYLIGYLMVLPFTLIFDTMFDGVAIAKNHSMPHQLLVLWGLPVILLVIFLIGVFSEAAVEMKLKRKKGLAVFMRGIFPSDLFCVVLTFCAMGLVLIPELVYVRDIYENGSARANTMFKLTYQAFILFGICMGYAIIRLLTINRKRLYKAAAVIGLLFLLWTVGYFGKAVVSWFPGALYPSRSQGLDATGFLEGDFPEDAGGIRWLKENIKGSPVILEANGDSYTEYERVSAMTGLPTVLGWYVHEWLWRNDTQDLNERSADIEKIYTGTDEEEVRSLIEQYNIQYIFLGSCERSKYEARLNAALIQSMGEVVYQDPNWNTCIVQVG